MKKKMTEVPNGVELNKFNIKNNILKAKKEINLLTVARYDEKKKGYDILPNLSQKLIDRKINFKWTIIGKNTHYLFKKK